MKSFILGCLAFATSVLAADYSDTEARTSLQLAQDAYCGKDAYMTHTYEGYAAGFIPTHVIYHWSDDTQGFIGYLPSNNSIYVSFRGSEDIRNWLTNLSIDKKNYKSFPECNCDVHSGFYDAEQAIIGDVLAEVARLKGIHQTAAIKVTGHSLGAAMAILTGMDLKKAGY